MDFKTAFTSRHRHLMDLWVHMHASPDQRLRSWSQTWSRLILADWSLSWNQSQRFFDNWSQNWSGVRTFAWSWSWSLSQGFVESVCDFRKVTTFRKCIKYLTANMKIILYSINSWARLSGLIAKFWSRNWSRNWSQS